jgi:hypothetical protein
MRIVAVELFQDRARIHWNLSPLPSYEAVLAGDLATLDGYTEGQTERDREHQRSSARLTQLYGLVRFTASDDLGTKYRYSRGGSGGGVQSGELCGLADVQPAVPADATELFIEVHGAKFTVPLR